MQQNEKRGHVISMFLAVVGVALLGFGFFKTGFILLGFSSLIILVFMRPFLFEKFGHFAFLAFAIWGIIRHV